MNPSKAMTPNRRAFALSSLLLLLPLAGCAEDSLPPRPTSSTSPFPYSYRWNLASERSTYLAVEFRVENETLYDFDFGVRANWTNSSFTWVHMGLFQRTNRSAIQRTDQNDEVVASCMFNPALERGDMCEPSSFGTDIGGSAGNTIAQGTYLLLLRAYNASWVDFDIEFMSRVPLGVLSIEEGRTAAYVLGTFLAGGPSEGLEANLSLTVSKPFLASFITAGRYRDAPNYAGVTDGARYAIRQSGNDCCYYDQDGRGVMEASFPGGAGNWTFSAHGGRRSEHGPGFALVGLTLDPSFVSAAGELRYFGPDWQKPQ